MAPWRLGLSLGFATVLAVMTWATVTASADRSVLVAAGEIWADPWGRATLIDAYFAFLTVYLWIAYRERRWIPCALWLVAILALGNFAIAAYFLIALVRLGPEGTWHDLFAPVGADPSLFEENRR